MSEKKKKVLKLVIIFGAILFNMGLFPIINLSIDAPKFSFGYIVYMIVIMLLFIPSITNDISLVCENLTQSRLFLYNLAIITIGLLARYILEFGEVSNTYNFTPINIILHILIVSVGIMLVYALNKKGERKRKIITVIVAGILAVSVVFITQNTPYKKAERFVRENSNTIVECLDNDLPLPNKLLGKVYNEWNGEHNMHEFILTTWGNTYYGCYYSPDDVPLPFQNADIDFRTYKSNSWEWKEEYGDNHGKTLKIKDKWYYFEASF